MCDIGEGGDRLRNISERSGIYDCESGKELSWYGIELEPFKLLNRSPNDKALRDL